MKSPFRAIRQKLFTEGKLLRYLTYAIGEIVLIIAGILIALKINDWNENRKAQAEFELYLSQLNEDVSEVWGNINENIGFYEDTALPAIEVIIPLLKKPELDDEELTAFETGLQFLNLHPRSQFRIGRVGQILDGNLEIIDRDTLLVRSAMSFQGDIGRNEAILSNIHRDIESRSSQLISHYAQGHNNRKSSYEIDDLRDSKQFEYLVYGSITSVKKILTFNRRLLRDVEAFESVLEEY